MINATSPAAKSSPMQTEAISAMDTSTSALMSKAVISPMAASSKMGTPHRMIAIHGIKRQRHRIQYADQKRSSGNDQQNDVLLDAAGFQKFLQSLYPLTHKRLPLYPMGYGYYIP